MTSKRRPGPVRPTFAVALAVLLNAPLPALAADGADSPQGVVDALKTAAEAEDFPAIARLLAPGARAEMTAALVVGVSMMVAFAQMGTEMGGEMAEAFAEEGATETTEEQTAAAESKVSELEAQLEAIFEKHGLAEALEEMEGAEGESGPEALAARLAGVDQPVLIGELLGLMKSLGDEGPQMSSSKVIPDGALEGLVIDGDSANGTVNGEPAHFVKVDGRWYLDPPRTDG
jgi:hypothetical protein